MLLVYQKRPRNTNMIEFMIEKYIFIFYIINILFSKKIIIHKG